MKPGLENPDRMILHALFDPTQDSIALFIEIRTASIQRTYRNREKKERSFPVNPYVSIEGLADIVRFLTGYPESLRKTRWFVRFPLVRELPLPSMPAGETCHGRLPDIVPLVPFYVPVILCPYGLFPDLWLHRERLQQRYIFGDSLRYLFHLMRFSLNLTKKGRFKPVIRRTSAGYIAGFEPSLTFEERGWIKGYSDLIPPLCRYVFPRKTDRDFVCSPDIRVYSCMTSMVQAIITRSMQKYTPQMKTYDQVLEWESNELTLLAFLTGIPPPSGKALEKGFADAIHTWLTYSGKEQKHGRFYPCISMQEPLEGEDQPWAIKYHLRSEADPSLIIPAEAIWNLTDTQDDLLPPSSFLKRELLSGLGKAAASSQLIRTRLTGTEPSTFNCTLSEAAEFLTVDAPELVTLGIDLILPLWMTINRQRPRIEIVAEHAGSQTGSMFGISDLISFDFRISLGGDSVSPEEFRKAVSLKMPFVRAGGRWISCDCPGISRIIQNIQAGFLKKRANAGDLIRISLTSCDEGDIEIAVVARDEWTADLLSMTGDLKNYEKIDVPQSFRGRLRPYQEVGYRFILRCSERRLGACLADDMGLGKTPQVLAWLLKVTESDCGLAPALIICPMSVVGNWEHEIRRFTPTIRYYVHHGTTRRKGEDFLRATEEYDLVITTYHLAARDIPELASIQWSAIILDEAQNIKSPYASQTKAIKKLNSRWRVALTGTPVENRLVELWSIMDFLNPGYLGGQKAFLDRYSARVEYENDKTATAELRRLISPFLLRRMKTDKSILPDLPEKMEYKVYCSLTYEQATLYQAVVDELAEKINQVEGIDRKGLILASITRLKQICNHPGLLVKDASLCLERSGKVRRIIEMLEEVIDEGDSALIFSQYATFAREVSTICMKHFSCPVLLLTGSTPRKERERLVAEFQSGNSASIFVISLKAGGTGLNLTAATHVFHIDRWWNPAVEEQATDRAFRIGQSRNVQVHLMIAAGTLEEKIDEMNTRKRILAEEVLAQGDDLFTTLPRDELISILALRDTVFSDNGGNP